MNSIGLENMGVEAFIETKLDLLSASEAVIGVNIVGHSFSEYIAVAQRLKDTKIDFLELNISCPNLAGRGGLSFGSDPDAAEKLTSEVVKACGDKPVVVKLPPLVSDIAYTAKKIENAGAAAISLINTVPALAIDLPSRRPMLGNTFGGLSGPPIKPIALRQVLVASRATTIPVIGVGGIFTATDALEFIVAGAAAVELATAILVDPTSPLTIIDDMSKWLEENDCSLADLKASLITG
jgi:dihydroorotate dehydrogenase (NAD+) catalytic subunit